MSFKCRLCDQTFEQIPTDAIEVTSKYHYTLYRFPDGLAHDVRRVPKPKQATQSQEK